MRLAPSVLALLALALLGADAPSAREIDALIEQLGDESAAKRANAAKELEAIGGPAGWTGFVRSLGDAASRLDRVEPALNDVPPGDTRDTTTPLAMLRDLQLTVLGKVLSPASRDRLAGWMVGCQTGQQREMVSVLVDAPIEQTVDVAGFDRLCEAHPEALGEPRQQARFMCGLSSPALRSRT